MLYVFSHVDEATRAFEKLRGRKATLSPFKVYIGRNSQETGQVYEEEDQSWVNHGETMYHFENDVYVGQTKQSISQREARHHPDADTKLARLQPSDPEYAAKRKFHRFRLHITLSSIISGLLAEPDRPRLSAMASLLEERNLRIEQGAREAAGGMVHFRSVEATGEEDDPSTHLGDLNANVRARLTSMGLTCPY